jgi:hypothetical protein
MIEATSDGTYGRPCAGVWREQIASPRQSRKHIEYVVAAESKSKQISTRDWLPCIVSISMFLKKIIMNEDVVAPSLPHCSVCLSDLMMIVSRPASNSSKTSFFPSAFCGKGFKNAPPAPSLPLPRFTRCAKKRFDTVALQFIFLGIRAVKQKGRCVATDTLRSCSEWSGERWAIQRPW